MSKKLNLAVSNGDGDGTDLDVELAEIQLKLNHVTEKVLQHLEADARDHIMVRKALEVYNEKQDKLDQRVSEFFSGVMSLKDEINKMGSNLASYNHHLMNHAEKSEINSRRVESIDTKFLELSEKQVQSFSEIQKFNTMASTVVKVFVGIGGTLGVIWVLMQMFSSLKGH